MGALAFDLADRLQTPIFVLLDLDIGMNERLCAPLEWDDSRVYDRGKIMTYEALEAGKDFGRYLDVDGDGIPYRTYPGTHPKRGSFFTRGSSKDRYARYTEDAGTPIRTIWTGCCASSKRRKASCRSRSSARPAWRPRSARSITVRPARRWARRLRYWPPTACRSTSLRVRGFPFGQEVVEFIDAHDQIFIVEQNRDAQLRMLLINECGIDPAKLVPVLHYDGTPITAQFISEGIADAVCVPRFNSA